MKSFETLIDLFRYAASIGEDDESVDPGNETFIHFASGPEQITRDIVQNYKGPPAFYKRDGSGDFQELPFPLLFKQAKRLALGLMRLGLERGERVGLIADNRPEWMMADIGILLNGAADVPRGTDSTPQELKYILEHSECHISFLENDSVLKKVIESRNDGRQSIPSVIIMLDEAFPRANLQDENPRIMHLQDLLEDGARASPHEIQELENRSNAVQPSDPFTVIYTSGTTGKPKGVVLSHANMAYNVNVVPTLIGVGPDERCLSILPIWHVFERCVEYCLLPYGASIYYARLRDLKKDFAEVRPTFMASAPRLWEKLYRGILDRMEKAEPTKKALFHAAVKIKKRYMSARDEWKGNTLHLPENAAEQNLFLAAAETIALALPAAVLDRIVFSVIRKNLGGKLKGTISGGGALPPHVDEFINMIGIPVYEGYGMTECAPIIAVRKKGAVIRGTVGFAPEGTEIKIRKENGEDAAPGEIGIIHVRGPQVMRGYYRNDSATAEALQDGWLNTGDIGLRGLEGALAIRGRAKDTIVLLGGENMEPDPIENLLRENEFIAQIMVVGQDRKFAGALIWPEIERLKSAGFDMQSTGLDLNQDDRIRAHFSAIIKQIISAKNGFKSFERIGGFQFLPEALAVGDELTNLFKMKRNVIAKKYNELIERMYRA